MVFMQRADRHRLSCASISSTSLALASCQDARVPRHAAFGIASRARFRHAPKRRSANASPVHTRTAPPAVTSPATVWPVKP